MRNIETLTLDEAQEILNFCFPNKNFSPVDLFFEPKFAKDRGFQLTLDGELVVGIMYHNNQDYCILHFFNSKVVLWLYQHGFNIEQFLIRNSDFSEKLKDFDLFAFAVSRIYTYDNLTVESINEHCKELLQRYYYKDYE